MADYYFDELILGEIRKNNEVVLRELYKTHYPMIFNLICSNAGTEQEAKDVYQETIIAFYEKVQQPDFALTCKIKTFLYAVARRLWLKRLSEKKRFQGNVEEGDTFFGIDGEMEEIEEREKEFKTMKESLESIGEPCRSILEDFYIKDLSMDQIRDKFGYTNADNAKNQKYKCLQRLKKIFFAGLNGTIK
jgi:RNA polymerase sigma factor (sigma-70 family)